MTLREIALKLLAEYEECGKYVNLSLNSHLTDALTKEERAALTAMLYTAVENKLKYDYFIGAFTSKSADKISHRTRNILRIGFAQLLDMDKIPDYVAINETVKLARNCGERGFINGVLRRAQRERQTLPYPNKEKNAVRYYSVYYSIPQELVKFFFAQLGERESVLLFDTFGKIPATHLTVNTMKISVDDFIAKLHENGYEATRGKFSPITVRVKGSLNPRCLQGFDDGEFFVQDEASAVCASVLGVREGEVMIDVCSAPGGKSFASAILSSDRARIYTFDLHENKLSLINGTKERLGLRSVTAQAHDAQIGCEELFGTADKVLCDVPCSGLGVIAKKSDLKYKDIKVTDELPELQKKIIETSARYLRRGGTLVYSTCTLNRRENEQVVADFLAENGDFYAEEFTLADIRSAGGCVTLYPHIHGTDGFFIAKLRKKS